MEASTKERLTGALILVAAVVVLVPEMLSVGADGVAGNLPSMQDPEAGAPLTTYDLRIDPVSATRPATQESLAPPSSPAPDPPAVPVPDNATPAAAGTAAPVAIAAAPPDVKAQPSASASAPLAAQTDARPAATSGKWWVQLGSFASRENAERLARSLRDAGYAIDVSQIRAQGKELFRVRAGPVEDRAAAEALRTRLGAAASKSTLVAP